MAGRNHLYIPGPTNVPNEILNAMHVPMEDHRSPAFPKLFAPLLEDLKKFSVQRQGKRSFSQLQAQRVGKLLSRTY